MKLHSVRKLRPGDRVAVRGDDFTPRRYEARVIRTTPRGGILVEDDRGERRWAPHWRTDRLEKIARSVDALDEEGNRHTMFQLSDTGRYVDRPPSGYRIV